MTFVDVVVYFLTMLNIYTLVLFIEIKSQSCVILFVYWDIYYMLGCSQYMETKPIGVLHGGKVIVTSNISYFMKRWSYGLISVGMVKKFASN